MKHTYQTTGTCSKVITFEMEDGIVHNIEFTGGCSGNLQVIASLVKGCSAEEIIGKCQGITCGSRATSCDDQRAKALRKAHKVEVGGR
ncbi:TIGR03905 family TSCPD domain-containing protein [Eubacterium aggregans]|uniref:TIGR03905 family TSCPD domain-containing protein n=1 Tax=Eubacterium aggregans TaxID=81409 RepID=UPI003F3FB6B5